jgi:hypothetical protein
VAPRGPTTSSAASGWLLGAGRPSLPHSLVTSFSSAVHNKRLTDFFSSLNLSAATENDPLRKAYCRPCTAFTFKQEQWTWIYYGFAALLVKPISNNT